MTASLAAFDGRLTYMDCQLTVVAHVDQRPLAAARFDSDNDGHVGRTRDAIASSAAT